MLTLRTGGGAGEAAISGVADEFAQPSVGSIGFPPPSRGAVRLGARTPSHTPAVAMPDPVAQDVARLEGEIAELKSALAETVSARLAGRDDKAVEDIRDSIRYLEAYFSISLPPKLDEMIASKLTVVTAAERSKRRARRWLAFSVLVNLALGAALAVEAQSGAVGRLAVSASSLVETGVQDASAVVVRGAARAAGLIAAAVE